MKRKIVDFMTFICCLAVSCLSLASCDSELDVRKHSINSPFHSKNVILLL